MTLLKKNILSLLLALVGGLALAHGYATSQGWEAILGIIVLAAAIVLLTINIVWRNTPKAER